MRSLRTFTVLTSLAVGWVSAAFGGVGDTLTGSVTPLGGVTNVTYSVESPKVMDTFVGYAISLGNTAGGTATATNTSLTVTATASDTQEVVKLVLNSDLVLPAGCTATAVNSFTCNVGQLKAGQSFPTFQVFFRAPTKVVNGSFDDVDPNSTADNDYVNINLTWFYAERTNHLNTNTNSSGSATDASVLIGTPNPTVVKSTLLKSGGLYFTGIGGVPTSADVYASNVKFDPLSAFAVLTLQETPFPTTDAKCLGGGHFKTCYDTLLTAPQVLYSPGAGSVTEIIRVHPDNFAKGAKMSTVIWEYTPTDAFGAPAGATSTVELCASPTTPRSDGLPCQTGPVLCYKNNSPLAGICEWTFINTRNGLMRGY
jgi:hypothetical protein